ncbi:MAG: hypothetical protein JNK73_14255 [Bacteroidia bacterium]|jgi:hypothetical protein|nr:hypothetical protein [Bacteroidia bacterium]
MEERSGTNTHSRLDGANNNQLRDEENSPRLGELYQEINDFAEVKLKIETLLRLKRSLGEADSNFAVLSEELKRCRLMVMESLDRLFSNYTPDAKAS